VDSPSVIPFSLDPEESRESDEATVLEIDAAIAMVLGRHALRVRLTALPFAERIAGLGAAHARAAGVQFRLETAERPGVRTVTVGPRE
jgi:hypothetical protein